MHALILKHYLHISKTIHNHPPARAHRAHTHTQTHTHTHTHARSDARGVTTRLRAGPASGAAAGAVAEGAGAVLAVARRAHGRRERLDDVEAVGLEVALVGAPIIYIYIYCYWHACIVLLTCNRSMRLCCRHAIVARNRTDDDSEAAGLEVAPVGAVHIITCKIV